MKRYQGVSENGATPKSMVFVWENRMKMDDKSGYPYFRKPPDRTWALPLKATPMRKAKVGSAPEAIQLLTIVAFGKATQSKLEQENRT